MLTIALGIILAFLLFPLIVWLLVRVIGWTIYLLLLPFALWNYACDYMRYLCKQRAP